MLGVDFMSENVRAILDNAGYTDVQVGTGTGAGGLLLLQQLLQRGCLHAARIQGHLMRW